MFFPSKSVPERDFNARLVEEILDGGVEIPVSSFVFVFSESFGGRPL